MNMSEVTPNNRDHVPAAPKKYQCTTCDRSFNKSEHLARHSRGHLNQRPFKCPQCSKSFGRQDVLTRHKKVHGNNQPPEPVQIPWATTAPPATTEKSDGYDPSQSEDIGQSNAFPQSPPDPHNVSAAQVPLEPMQPWAYSGDMLDLLLSDPNSTNNWPVPLPVMQLEPLVIQPDLENSIVAPCQVGQQSNGYGPGHQAMQQLSKLILDLSSGLTAEIESTGITSGFLDTCMHVFFERFHTSFPILHKATFQVRESSHPLLLNIIALGSLFVGAKDAIAKGETLWRLAHTAVATSWQTLITTRGSRDQIDGVQLVLTALIGQTYALLSKNESLRMTSQVFHGLGFSWARECGWYNLEEYDLGDVPSLDSPEDQKLEAWYTWAAREVQNRAILGHYILDGQISQFSGHSPSARHVTNSLFMPTHEAAFAATTSNDWILEMGKHNLRHASFRELYVSLFSHQPAQFEHQLSNFSVRVILEGMQSLISDAQEGDGPAVGTPSESSIAWALVRLYRERLGHSDQNSVENMELLVRWHAICLNLATPATTLCQRMCSLYGIQQQLHREIKLPRGKFNFEAWSRSVDGRRALLHAMAIQDLVERLPLGRSHAIHLPAAIFAVATIYSARCIAGLQTILVPKTVLWEDVWANEKADTTKPDEQFSTQSSDMTAFLNSRALEGDTLKRNLMYDLNSLQITLSSMSLRWGVSHTMDDILNRWIIIANQGSQRAN